MVRASTIPEELGRISYLLTDKTGWRIGNLLTKQTIYYLFDTYNLKITQL